MADCTDGEGNTVGHGEWFFPRSDDYCYNCHCNNGTEGMCISAACAMPTQCDDHVKIEKTCCGYICPNNTHPDSSAEDALSAAGIRLAASVATCVLVVMIILFVMHRFRRNRLLLNIRHGLTGHTRSGDTSVTYSSEYDGVDIGISYERLHMPGAPPPYSPRCEESPPAYSTIPKHSTTTPTGTAIVSGVVNAGCQTTPPESMYDLSAHSAVANQMSDTVSPPYDNVSPHCDTVSPPYDTVSPPYDTEYMYSVEPTLRTGNPIRTCGVGASITDLTLTVDMSDSTSRSDWPTGDDTTAAAIASRPTQTSSSTDITTNNMTGESCSSLNLSTVSIDRHDGNISRLPQRLEPVGGELPPIPPTLDALDVDSGKPNNMRVSKSAGNSPSVVRRQEQTGAMKGRRSDVTLTQYGFVDCDMTAGDLEANAVVGLSEEQLKEIVANRPDRINARVRRQNRIKQLRNSCDIQHRSSFS